MVTQAAEPNHTSGTKQNTHKAPQHATDRVQQPIRDTPIAEITVNEETTAGQELQQLQKSENQNGGGSSHNSGECPATTGKNDQQFC